MKTKTLAPLDPATLARLERVIFLNSRTFVWTRAKITNETLASGLEGRRMQLAKRRRLERLIARLGYLA